MEIEVRESRVAATGTSDKGPWELISVTTVDGTEFTTFDKKAKPLTEGTVIEIGNPKTKDGKLGFAKVLNVVKEGKAPMSQHNGGSYQADPLKMASEERRSRMHAIKDLWLAGILDEKSLEVKKLRKWLMEGQVSPDPKKPEPKQEPAEDLFPEESQGGTTDLKALPIANLGNLFSACLHHFKMNQSDVLKEMGGITKEQISDPQEAWLQIVEAKS